MRGRTTFTITESTARVKSGTVLIAGLLRDGFRPGAPPRVSLLARTIDAEVCQEIICPNCHGTSLAYRPFVKGNTYRVVALCRCGHGEEI
jgi:hypothetical protein